MRKFVCGKIISIVEDDDRRIVEYEAKKSGWKEVEFKAPEPRNDAMGKALKDVKSSEAVDDGLLKETVPSKKVNDAIKANAIAKKSSEAVDDGLNISVKPNTDKEDN